MLSILSVCAYILLPSAGGARSCSIAQNVDVHGRLQRVGNVIYQISPGKILPRKHCPLYIRIEFMSESIDEPINQSISCGAFGNLNVSSETERPGGQELQKTEDGIPRSKLPPCNPSSLIRRRVGWIDPGRRSKRRARK